METLKLSKTNLETCAARAADVLRAGGVVLYPTDTLYGLGADIFSDAAVDTIYAIKGRDERKPIHCIVADIEMAKKYGEFDEIALLLAKEFWPGALTLVLKKKQGIDTGIGRGTKTIGIRIPNNEFCLALARRFGKPYTTTSANISGETPQRSVAAILAQLEHTHIPKYVGMIDLIVDAGKLPRREASTVVDLCGARPVILREGAVPSEEIREFVGTISKWDSAAA